MYRRVDERTEDFGREDRLRRRAIRVVLRRELHGESEHSVLVESSAHEHHPVQQRAVVLSAREVHALGTVVGQVPQLRSHALVVLAHIADQTQLGEESEYSYGSWLHSAHS